MSTYRCILSWALTALSCLAFGSRAQAQRADIQPPQARDAVVQRALRLIERNAEEATALSVDAVNPFDPTSKTAKSESVASDAPKPVVRVSLSDDQQLRRIAPTLLPTGTISLAGESYLLFGQKKFKVGDYIPINFEGGTYSVLLTDVQSTSFTIRLGDAETVRPIKLPNKQ